MHAVSVPLEILATAPSVDAAFASLDEPIRSWFRSRFAEPTAAQRLAWPALEAGRNLLLCSPTGSGKTLAAFLPIINQLLFAPNSGGIRCLYVAPYKALVHHTHRTLKRCLRDLRPWLPEGYQIVRVGLRTGDTPAGTRRLQKVEPPEMLVTTPESLAVLLSQASAAELFRDLRWLVVDEVHALAPNKRGADLALSLERLEGLHQVAVRRVGLSATCEPVEESARFLVGVGRSCTVARVSETTPLQLRIEPLEETGPFLSTLVDRLRPELEANRTTLIFTNTRSLAERLTWMLTQHFPDWADAIGVHHSSLATARRRAVELRLKRGRLRAVVSSTSLELGIDIGSVDAVVLVHPPGEVVRLLQRVGRAGHGPGRLRRGLVFTATTAELLEAAVTVSSGQLARCEPLRVCAHPLDVLCQQLVGLAAQGWWSAAEAFALVRRAYPFRELPRDDFDACLDYLSGRRAGDPTWLPPRLRWEEDRFTIQDERTARILRRNVGTIIAEEPRPVVQLVPQSAPGTLDFAGTALEVERRPVGQVEEGFVDQLNPGDRFLLGGRCLEFRHTEGPAVVVEEVVGRPRVPRWTGSGWPLSAELAGRLYLLRVQAAEALRDGPAALADLLGRDYALEDGAIRALTDYFQRQECLSEIPDRATCLVEVVADAGGTDYYIHTPLNRLGNEALVRLAVHRLARHWRQAVRSLVADLGFQLSVGVGFELTPERLRALLSAQGFEADLSAALAGSVALRERFRRVALTALMLLRNPLGPRRRVGGPDWAQRRLVQQVREAAPDFVLLRQAEREMRAECGDAGAARRFLDALPNWTLRVRRLPEVSPFATAWTQLAAGPEEQAETPEEALRRLHARLTGAGSGPL
jgi:ATP-dependent Lhr-like helicase